LGTDTFAAVSRGAAFASAVFLTATDFTADLPDALAVSGFAAGLAADFLATVLALAVAGFGAGLADLDAGLADLAELAVRVLALAVDADFFGATAGFLLGFFATVAFIALSFEECPTLVVIRPLCSGYLLINPS
jgi:hypothetical protein